MEGVEEFDWLLTSRSRTYTGIGDFGELVDNVGLDNAI